MKNTNLLTNKIYTAAVSYIHIDAHTLLSKAIILTHTHTHTHTHAHILDDGLAEAETFSRYRNLNNKKHKSLSVYRVAVS